MASYSSSILIAGLDANLNVARALTLLGGGLPKMGEASWGLESQLSTTYYPGNPLDATQQFTVAKEVPSEWAGEWNLTRLNRAPCLYDADGSGAATIQIVSPGMLIDILEDMQLTGQLLKVSWVVDSDDPNVARTVTRLGRLSKFEAHYVRSVDVTWQATFAWKSRGRTLGRVATTREGDPSSATSGIVATQAAIADLVNSTMISSNPNINLSATRFTLGQLESLLQAPQDLLSSFTQSLERISIQIGQAVDLADQTRALPASLEGTIVTLARNVVDQANQYQDEFSVTPVEQWTSSDEVADLARAVTYFGQIEDSSVQATISAQDAIRQIRTARGRAQTSGEQVPQTLDNGGILAIWRTRQGDTPQSIALRFYGTIDQDIAILRANRLPYYQAAFDPGTLLVIPVVSQTSASNL